MEEHRDNQYPPPSAEQHDFFDLDSSTSVLVSEKVVLEGRVGPATLIVSKKTGKIIAIHPSVLPQSLFRPAVAYHNYSPCVLMPGIVDTHVHFNEPGRTSTEGFFTGTKAAIAGGVTTIVDMPLNSIPPTTTMSGFKAKVEAADGNCWCDVGFLGGIVPGNRKELKPLVDAGVRGFKSFLIDSGVPEFPAVTYTDLRDAMLELANSPTMLMFHAERIPSHIPDFERLKGEPAFLYPSGAHLPLYVYDNFLASRPPVFEDEAIEMLIDLSTFAPKLPLHIAHVSTAEALPILRKAQAAGVNVSAETCFHYLALSSEEVPLRDTRFKSEPPIRSKTNQNELWKALRRLERDDEEDETSMRPPKLRLGPITMIISDHSPCAPSAKFLPAYIPPHAEPVGYHDDVIAAQSGNFFKAWGGIASVGLGLSILWTEFGHRGMLSEPDGESGSEREVNAALVDLSFWMSRNPALLVGLGTQKGQLRYGYDADILVFDPEAQWTVTESDLLYKHKMSPYQGREMKGKVVSSWLRGREVWNLEKGFEVGGGSPDGKTLLEKRRPEIADGKAEESGGVPDGSSWSWMDRARQAMLQNLFLCLGDGER